MAQGVEVKQIAKRGVRLRLAIAHQPRCPHKGIGEAWHFRFHPLTGVVAIGIKWHKAHPMFAHRHQRPSAQESVFARIPRHKFARVAPQHGADHHVGIKIFEREEAPIDGGDRLAIFLDVNQGIARIRMNGDREATANERKIYPLNRDAPLQLNRRIKLEAPIQTRQRQPAKCLLTDRFEGRLTDAINREQVPGFTGKAVHPVLHRQRGFVARGLRPLQHPRIVVPHGIGEVADWDSQFRFEDLLRVENFPLQVVVTHPA